MSTVEMTKVIELSKLTEFDFRINGWVESFRVKNAEGAKLFAHGVELLTVPTSDYIVDFKQMMLDFYNKEYTAKYLDCVLKDNENADKYSEQLKRIFSFNLRVSIAQLFITCVNDTPNKIDGDIPDEPDYRYFGLNMHRCIETKFTNCMVKPEITDIVRVNPELLPTRYQNVQFE
ncbi:Hypothetical protein PACV_277 [Pacmanvirus A23]|uniref:Hypothetical protein n=1 Tax=Pacmanvirus A23 TaxID=1932881 RepID=UPI000A094E75|nr:Hypothetical protein B9W72_gp273 [Pacmanvirus A23]SIP85990.1 Hypothetical protein PACV_277 [Pacmanvirus A23]